MPTIGFRPIEAQIKAPKGGITTNPAPPVQSAITHAKTKIAITFKSDPLEFARPLRAAWKKPAFSAIPTPNMQVKVSPNAGIPVKLFTNSVSIRTNPCLLNKLTTWTLLFVTGLISLTPKK